jgi:CheY-like chemotaxis protein
MQMTVTEVFMRATAAKGLRGLKLLLVDDQDDWRDSLGELLGSYGAAVTSCPSAAAARHELQQRSFDVLISDIHMPIEDGWSLIAFVRESESRRRPRLPTVAMSTCDDLAFRARIESSGFDAFISKYSSIAAIVCRLEELTASR